MTNRTKLSNGSIRIKDNIIAAEDILYYRGYLLHKQLDNLDPNKLYAVYNPADVIKKATDGIGSLPIDFQHRTSEYLGETILGTTIGSPQLDEKNNLVADIEIWNTKALNDLESIDELKFSLEYISDIRQQSGTFKGKNFDIITDKIIPLSLSLTNIPRSTKTILKDSILDGENMDNQTLNADNNELIETKLLSEVQSITALLSHVIARLDTIVSAMGNNQLSEMKDNKEEITIQDTRKDATIEDESINLENEIISLVGKGAEVDYCRHSFAKKPINYNNVQLYRDK
jgi:hypothetical protein